MAFNRFQVVWNEKWIEGSEAGILFRNDYAQFGAFRVNQAVKDASRDACRDVLSVSTLSVQNERDPSKTSVSGHFRIWKDVYDSLEGEARAREISLNTLVNQLLSAHTRDDSLFERIGIVKLPKDTYRLMLQLIPEERLAEFGHELIKRWPTTLMLARQGAITPDAIKNHFRDTSKMGFLSMYETQRNGTKVISLTHEFGPRYSAVLCAAVAGLYAMVGIQPQITTTDSSVTVEY